MLVNTTAVHSSELGNVPRHRPEGSKARGIESISRLRGTQEDMWKDSQWFHLPWQKKGMINVGLKMMVGAICKCFCLHDGPKPEGYKSRMAVGARETTDAIGTRHRVNRKHQIWFWDTAFFACASA